MKYCVIEALARIYLIPKIDGATLDRVEFTFSVSKNMNQSAYMDENEKPTKSGSHAITQAFIQGLAANIKFAHHEGYRDEVDHIRYINEELARTFATAASVEHAEMAPIETL